MKILKVFVDELPINCLHCSLYGRCQSGNGILNPPSKIIDCPLETMPAPATDDDYYETEEG